MVLAFPFLFCYQLFRAHGVEHDARLLKIGFPVDDFENLLVSLVAAALWRPNSGEGCICYGNEFDAGFLIGALGFYAGRIVLEKGMALFLRITGRQAVTARLQISEIERTLLLMLSCRKF